MCSILNNAVCNSVNINQVIKYHISSVFIKRIKRTAFVSSSEQNMHDYIIAGSTQGDVLQQRVI